MPKIVVIQVNVTDMDAALDFYCGKLGFAVHSKTSYPNIVRLEHEAIRFILNRVKEKALGGYPDVAQTIINIGTENLQRDLKRLRAAGVEVLHDAPLSCPAGIYAAIRDPSGNVLELIEHAT
jgi:catechol 2,3-dioxygenase-like lactoylglutathione lyase family enzyme